MDQGQALFDRMMETLREANRLPYPRHECEVAFRAALDAYVDWRVQRVAERVRDGALDVPRPRRPVPYPIQMD